MKQPHFDLVTTARRHGRGRSAAGRDLRPIGSARITCAVIVALVLMHALATPAQEVTEWSLKAAGVYNFASFTRWPEDAASPSGPFVMCVLGDSAVADALERSVKGRKRAGRMMTVSRVTPSDSLRGCHLLYLSHVSATQAGQMVTTLHELPVLTLSDMEGFGDLGGMARLYFERGQLNFKVHNETAKRAHLEISSRLLQLAK